VAAAPPALFEPDRLAAAALVSGLADVCAALFISAAAAEVRTAPGLAAFFAARSAALAADVFPTEAEAAAALPATTLRAGSGLRGFEPRALPLLAAVAPFAAAFPPVVFAIAISPPLYRSCLEKTN